MFYFSINLAFFIVSQFSLFFWTSSCFPSSEHQNHLFFSYFINPFIHFQSFCTLFCTFLQSAWSHCMQRKNQSHYSSSRERQSSGSPISFPVFLCLWTLDKITVQHSVFFHLEPNWLWDQSHQVHSQPRIKSSEQILSVGNRHLSICTIKNQWDGTQ